MSLPRERLLFIGTAGWNIPKPLQADFPTPGTHLERYARRLNATEINSSFYRHHAPETYARWAASVRPGFRFAVKVPRTVTHLAPLRDLESLGRFREESAALAEHLGPWLVQLPPRLTFDPEQAEQFFAQVRRLHEGAVVCEPRHPSWFSPEAEALLRHFHIARVAAHPPPHPLAAFPGGWEGLHYYRLHGSPRLYVSAYSGDFLRQLAERIRHTPPEIAIWLIFNNTAAGAALPNALEMQSLLSSPDEH